MTRHSRPLVFMAWAVGAALSAFLLAMVSDLWFGSGNTVLLKWLPNVGALILAFSIPRRSLGGLLAGHAVGLFIAGLEHTASPVWHQWHHVGADVLEVAAMIVLLGRIAPDGRLQRSSDFLRVALNVVLVPSIASASLFAFGEALAGRYAANDLFQWMAASIGVSAIVMMPWLAARSHLADDPLAGTDAKGRRLRIASSVLLLALAFALPLAGQTQDDAFVALLILMASAWLPLWLVALLMAIALGLHDSDIRQLLGFSNGDKAADALDILRACVIGMAALYVRMLIAENRRALRKAGEEREIRERENARFVDLVDQIDGIVWEADAETARFTFVSGAARRLTGYSSEEWLQPGFWLSHMHPDDVSWAPSFCASETQAGRDHAFDYRFIAKDGRTIWIRDIVTLRRVAAGRLVLAGVMVDITTTKQASFELEGARASLDRLAMRHRLALMAGGIGVWETDLDSGESDWDETMFGHFAADPKAGLSPRRLMRERLAPESYERARAALQRIRAGQDSPYTEDYAVHWPSGEVRRLRTVAAPMRSDGGRACLVGACWDCSMEYLAEEALRSRASELASVLETEALRGMHARTRAAQAEAIQRDLIANVSHELRTPLHAILGFLELARDDLGEGEGSAAHQAGWKIERSHQAAKRLLAQVDDLLDMAKLESGSMILRKRRVDMLELVGTVREELDAMLKAKAIEVRVVASTEDERAALLVEADDVRMLQVLRNVLANAVRFSPEASVIHVYWELHPLDGAGISLEIRVEDQGPGIPEDQIEAVFGKFVQARESDRRTDGGTGLGLPIARQIARAHGGDLRALPSDSGAILVLSLPLARQ